MRTITLEEYFTELRAQEVDLPLQATFKCPLCGTLQTAADLIAAGAGEDFEAVEKYLGFSCVGRFTGAGPARKKPDGKACNYTLGGLFKLHKLEVITQDGNRHPRFEPATPEEAQAHNGMRRLAWRCIPNEERRH